MGHAEVIPEEDLNKAAADSFYLPMYSIKKSSSSTTKLRIVFDASARTQMDIHLMTLSFQVHASIQQSQISCFASGAIL